MYGQAVQLAVTGGWVAHLSGLPWYRLPLPRRWHTCQPDTIARLGVMYPDLYHRCACGGWRVRHFGADDYTPWTDRNSRRKGRAHSLTIH